MARKETTADRAGKLTGTGLTPQGLKDSVNKNTPVPPPNRRPQDFSGWSQASREGRMSETAGKDFDNNAKPTGMSGASALSRSSGGGASGGSKGLNTGGKSTQAERDARVASHLAMVRAAREAKRPGPISSRGLGLGSGQGTGAGGLSDMASTALSNSRSSMADKGKFTQREVANQVGTRAGPVHDFLQSIIGSFR